jgi:hypothetical protein
MAMELPKSPRATITAGCRGRSAQRRSLGEAFSKADLKRFGDVTPPDDRSRGVRGDLGEKEAVLAANPKAFFTIPHFDGYAAVLIQLRLVGKRALRDAIIDGWLACAPTNLADEYAARQRGRRP